MFDLESRRVASAGGPVPCALPRARFLPRRFRLGWAASAQRHSLIRVGRVAWPFPAWKSRPSRERCVCRHRCYLFSSVGSCVEPRNSSRRISAVQMKRTSAKRRAAGRKNYARKAPEYAVGQRVQRGEARGTIADVNFQSGRQGLRLLSQPEALASKFAASSDLASQIASPRDFAGNRWLQCPVSPSRACYFRLHSGGCLLTWGRGAFKLQTRTVPLVAGAKRSSSDAVAPVPSPCSPRARRIRRHRAL